MASVGVVVVGMGNAGKLRVRDLLEVSKKDQTKNVKLIGYVSRRILNIDGLQQLTFEEALGRDDVHIMIIATENKFHFEQTKKCIEVGKHVIVEFPLATNARDVAELQKLAETNVPVNSWIGDFENSGSPFTSYIVHLHVMHDFFGDFTPVQASLTEDDTGFEAVGIVKTKDGKPVTIKIRFTKQPSQRSTAYKFVFEDGTEYPGVPRIRNSLFMRDFMQFFHKVADGSPVLPSPEATLHCHQVADALFKLTGHCASK